MTEMHGVRNQEATVTVLREQVRRLEAERDESVDLKAKDQVWFFLESPPCWLVVKFSCLKCEACTTISFALREYPRAHTHTHIYIYMYTYAYVHCRLLLF